MMSKLWRERIEKGAPLLVLNGLLFGVPAWVWVLAIGAIIALIGYFAMSDARQRKQRNWAIGIGVAVVVLALILGPLAALVFAPAQVAPNTPAYRLDLAETSCYNFPDFSTDGACASGNTQIVFEQLPGQTPTVTVKVTLDNSDNTVAPDSFAIMATVHRTDEGWVESGVLVSTPVSVSMSPATLPSYFNTTRVPVVRENPSGIQQYAWTDFADNAAGVGNAAPGVMGTLAPGASDHVTFSLYFNEVPAFADLGGSTASAFGSTSITKTVTLNLTIAGLPVNVIINFTWQA